MMLVGYPCLASVTYDTRVLQGQQAPGTLPGVSFTSFDNVAITSTGQVAFRGFLSGAGIFNTSNSSGIWSEAAGVNGLPGLVARKGEAAPDTAVGVNFDDFDRVVLSGNGHTLFTAELSGPGVDNSNRTGIWSNTPGLTSLAVRAGDQLPVTDLGLQYRGFSTPVANTAGQFAFEASLFGTGVNDTNSSGVWVDSVAQSNSSRLVARIGANAPGTDPSTNFEDFIGPINLNASGQIAFAAKLIGPEIDLANDRGIWSEAAGLPGTLALVAREGDPAPGTAAGVNYGAFNGTSFNRAGQTAFAGFLSGSGVDTTNNRAIWSEAAGSLGSPGLIARSGEAAPGTADGVMFSAFGDPVINDEGQVAFRGFLAGEGLGSFNQSGIWSESAGAIGSPELIALAGLPAPGAGQDVTFTGFEEPNINAAGQVAFIGRLSSTDVNPSLDRGIWATDTDGELKLIVREGGLFDVNDDPSVEDLRTVISIRSLSSTGNGDGRSSSFNDSGELVFTAIFSDFSSGIFVASVASDLLGDYNGNGIVDAADYTIWADTFNSTTDLAADGNGDGVVDAADYTIWADNFGDTTPALAIPEPATVCFAGLGGLWLVNRRRITP